MEAVLKYDKSDTRWLAWLTPWVCRGLFAALLLWGAVSHVQYLHDSPLDLSGDEAQYWDWSRQLGWSYYSKGPLVAWIIRASTSIFGNTMPAVRYPAMVLAVGTSICTYWLVRRLFGSDRLALGTGLLYHFVPVFIAGSIMMTIDPPFFFCWALATCLAAKGLLGHSAAGSGEGGDRASLGAKWVWPVVGLVLGVGFLAKYAMFLWWAGLVVFLLVDKPSRRWLRSGWFWSMVPIALACTAPVVVWNVQHGWASFEHVKEQTGTGFEWTNPVELLGGQAAILGLSLTIIMAGAVIYALRRISAHDPYRRAMRFLLAIGLSFFAIVFFNSLRSKIQPNWPAPAYFTLMILTAYFLSIRLGSGAPHKWWWRTNLAFVIVGGMILTPLAHDFSVLYPYLGRIDAVRKVFGAKKPLTIRQIDPTYKLRGWQELGRTVGLEERRIGPGAFILTDDYQTSAALAFYVPGQPKTYYGGSYFQQAPARFCQYDMWPDRNLEPDKTTLLGRNAVYVGYIRKDLREAFDRVEQLPDVVIMVKGFEVRRFPMWLLYNFHGLPRRAPVAQF